MKNIIILGDASALTLGRYSGGAEISGGEMRPTNMLG